MGKFQKLHEWHGQNVEKIFNAVGGLKDKAISGIRNGIATLIGSGSVIQEIGKMKESAKLTGIQFKEDTCKTAKELLSFNPIGTTKAAINGLIDTIKNTGTTAISSVPTALATIATPVKGVAKGVKAVGTTIAKPGKYAIQGIGAIATGVKKYFTDTTPPATASSDISAGPAKSATPPLPDKPKADTSMPEEKTEPEEKPADKPEEDKQLAA